MLLGCLALGLLYGRPSAGQAPAAPSATRRYQVLTAGKENDVVVFEPGTGQCWTKHNGAGGWDDHRSPVIKKRDFAESP